MVPQPYDLARTSMEKRSYLSTCSYYHSSIRNSQIPEKSWRGCGTFHCHCHLWRRLCGERRSYTGIFQGSDIGRLSYAEFAVGKLSRWLPLTPSECQKEGMNNYVMTQVERNIRAAKKRKELRKVGGKLELFLGQGRLTAGSEAG